MSDTAKPQAVQQKSGMRIPGFAQLQRLGKSLMLPIAVLPAAGILLRLGQDDLLGRIEAPVIGPFFKAMSAAAGRSSTIFRCCSRSASRSGSPGRPTVPPRSPRSSAIW